MTKWKVHPQLPFVLISDNGEIKTKNRIIKRSDGKTQKIIGKNIKLLQNTRGYYDVVICYQGKKHHIRPHRIVAELFIPNPMNKPEVNHIDGNKLNNNVSNLEWSTRKENIHHAMQLGLLKHKPKAIETYTCKTCGKLFQKPKNKNYKFCSQQCSSLNQRRVKRPPIKDLLKLTKTHTYVDIAKIYGVSDNTIRKWIRNSKIS